MSRLTALVIAVLCIQVGFDGAVLVRLHHHDEINKFFRNALRDVREILQHLDREGPDRACGGTTDS